MDNSTKNTVGSVGKLSQLQLPVASEFGLSGGLEGLLIDAPNSQSMLMEIIFRAGDYLCPKDKPDLAHFLEHLVIKANRDYPSQAEFNRAISAKGGQRNASTGIDNVCYFFSAPDFDWSRMFDLMLTAVSRPLFLPVEFESEKRVVRQEHKRRLDNRQLKISLAADQQSGYHLTDPNQRLACLDSITLEDVIDYYRQTHTLSNARVIVSGNLPPKRQQLIKQKLEGLDLPVGSGRPKLPPGKLKGAGLVYQEDSEANTVYYQLSFLSGGLVLSPDQSLSLALLRNLWMSNNDSRIYGQARERGLIYHISGGFDSTDTSVHFDFSGQVNLDKLEELIDLVLAEVDRLLAGDLSEAEVDRHKEYALGIFQMVPSEPGRWARYQRGRYLVGKGLVPFDYGFRLESIDKDLIIDTARRIFESFDWTLGLLGNIPEDVRRRLETKLNQRKAR